MPKRSRLRSFNDSSTPWWMWGLLCMSIVGSTYYFYTRGYLDFSSKPAPKPTSVTHQKVTAKPKKPEVYATPKATAPLPVPTKKSLTISTQLIARASSPLIFQPENIDPPSNVIKVASHTPIPVEDDVLIDPSPTNINPPQSGSNAFEEISQPFIP
ncbi:MAG: hypothetical protein SGI71_09645 [Verrucomicrobiota bacterium]|nr:hypothetical protein [Verrucomicrobiota bacterium]